MSPSHSSHVLACHLKMVGWEQHLRPSAGAPRTLCQTTGLAFASCSFHRVRLLFTYACSSRLLPIFLMRQRAEHPYQFSSDRGKYNFHVVLKFLISSFLFLCWRLHPALKKNLILSFSWVPSTKQAAVSVNCPHTQLRQPAGYCGIKPELVDLNER